MEYLKRDMGSLTLDLSRAECRDRVVRVLGGTDWVYVPSVVGWRLWLDRQPSDRGEGRYYPASGPALAGLDPTDDTRLPDGSRLVDALALAAVARHVLGATAPDASSPFLTIGEDALERARAATGAP